VQVIGYVANNRAVSDEPLLDDSSHEFAEAVLSLALFQLLFKLWNQQLEKLRIPCHKWPLSIAFAKHYRVARCSESNWTAEVLLNRFGIATLLHEFQP